MLKAICVQYYPILSNPRTNTDFIYLLTILYKHYLVTKHISQVLPPKNETQSLHVYSLHSEVSKSANSD